MQTGDDVLISGTIIQDGAGSSKRVILRALGPSLEVAGALQDPFLELFDGSGVRLFANDNWKDTQRTQIEQSQLAPEDDRESAIVMMLTPGNYTAVMSGVDATTGVGLTEIYDLERDSSARVGNISTRGFVGTGGNVLIGGFILEGSGTADLLVRAIGPSLSSKGVANALADPTLELVDPNGNSTSNDDWRSDQEAEIEETTIPPSDDREAAIRATLPAGDYTAIVRGADGSTGVALVEIYNLESSGNGAR